MNYWITTTIISLVMGAGSIKSEVATLEEPGDDFVTLYCPDVTHCISGTTIFSDTIPLGLGGLIPEPEVGNCYSVPFIPEHLKFSVESSELEIVLEWETTGDMQMAIIDACYSSGECVINAACNDGGQLTLNASNLLVGHTYLLSVDACSVGSGPFEVTMTPGPPGPFQTITDITLIETEECNNGLSENTFCKGLDLMILPEGPNENVLEHLLNGDATWHLELSGDSSELITLTDLTGYRFNFPNEGSFAIEIVSVDLECNSYDVGISYGFDIVSLDEDLGVYEVCTHELDNWTPGTHWLGPSISSPGTHEYYYEDECSCPYSQKVTVIELEEKREEVIFEFCPEDYPYDYFGYYELEYHPDNYELMLEFEHYSLQENWQGDHCDTLVHLFVVNENPEGRCGFCDIPISLEPAELVYCINFDNATFDVSGNANPVEAEGISYDNNGPASNNAWEAVLDGRDEYIRMPHSDALNTSAFAMDLKFNKDEAFNGSGVETLASKGDPGKNNLRYRLSLEALAEDKFRLVAAFSSESQTISLTTDSLSTHRWYGATVVSDEDSVFLYLDGARYSEAYFPETLKGNQHDLFLGASEENGELDLFYEGRLDDFKYWKQPLSGQDVLYLYEPEKQFEFNLGFFHTCCDTSEFRGVEISQDNPLDTFTVVDAAPGGYDSVFILRHINIGQGPQLKEPDFFSDILIEKEIECEENCQETVTWTEPDLSSFVDACGVASITASHTSPLVLNDQMSYVEVVYHVENACGDVSLYNFTAELNCTAADYVSLPDANHLELVRDTCGSMQDSIYCVGETVAIRPAFFDSINGGLSHDYSEIEAFGYRLMVMHEDGPESLVASSNTSGVNLVLSMPGIYQICLESVESRCEYIETGVCMEIEAAEVIKHDHGNIQACEGSLEEVLPSTLSPELTADILSSGSPGVYERSYTGECGCLEEETIIVTFIGHEEPSEIYFELCENDSPVTILGQTFEPATYNDTLLVFENASQMLDANGNACDSMVLLTIEILEEAEEVLDVEICEGSEYNGYDEPGTYTDVYTGSNGCDSTRILNLYIVEEIQEFLDVSICEGESYQDYSETGTYIQTDESANGCDSVTHINLTVIETILDSMAVSICPGESYMGFTEEGTYTQYYTALSGCDSIVAFTVTVLDENDPLCEISSTSNEEQSSSWSVYPNPTSSILYFVNKTAAEGPVYLRVYDVFGGVHLEKEGRFRELDVSQLSAGIYYLKISHKLYGESVHRFVKIN